MRLDRRLLYSGVFLVAIGVVIVATDLGGTDSGAIAGALRLWPLAFLAIGAAIVLRRSRYGLTAGLLAAAVPGLVLGGGLALGADVAVECGANGPPAAEGREGTFDRPARVAISASCGTLLLETATGSTWRFDGGNTSGPLPLIEESASSLSIDARGRDGWFRRSRPVSTWEITLPTSAIDELSIAVNAGEGRLDLADAQIGRLELGTNAGEAIVDLSGATVATLDGAVNAGRLAVTLPAEADLHGTIEVNAGALEICAPAGLGVQVRHSGSLGGLSVNGEHVSGDVWESPSYASAAHRADLNVAVNLGSVEINPIGGCL